MARGFTNSKFNDIILLAKSQHFGAKYPGKLMRENRGMPKDFWERQMGKSPQGRTCVRIPQSSVFCRRGGACSSRNALARSADSGGHIGLIVFECRGGSQTRPKSSGMADGFRATAVYVLSTRDVCANAQKYLKWVAKGMVVLYNTFAEMITVM